MKYLKVFTDFADAMEELGDAERGRLFTAMLKYAETGAAPDFRGNERFIWPVAKLQIDRMAAECEGRAKTSRENGSKGGRPKKTQGNPENQAGFSKTQKSQDKDNDKDKDKDKDKENIPSGNNTPHTPQGGRFAEFWALYPKKVGKGAAEKAFDRIKPDKQTFDRMVSAISAQKQSRQWRENNGQYIPNPATWLNQRRWEDEVTQAAEDTDNIFWQMLQEEGQHEPY